MEITKYCKRRFKERINPEWRKEITFFQIKPPDLRETVLVTILYLITECNYLLIPHKTDEDGKYWQGQL